nr:hypothetical protein CFP56_69216 [Quercus suber]
MGDLKIFGEIVTEKLLVLAWKIAKWKYPEYCKVSRGCKLKAIEINGDEGLGRTIIWWGITEEALVLVAYTTASFRSPKVKLKSGEGDGGDGETVEFTQRRHGSKMREV